MFLRYGLTLTWDECLKELVYWPPSISQVRPTLYPVVMTLPRGVWKMYRLCTMYGTEYLLTSVSLGTINNRTTCGTYKYQNSTRWGSWSIVPNTTSCSKLPPNPPRIHLTRRTLYTRLSPETSQWTSRASGAFHLKLFLKETIPLESVNLPPKKTKTHPQATRSRWYLTDIVPTSGSFLNKSTK